MIDEIVVTNVALIRHASFQPSSGLTVLTGETGAGKTALLSAISLLIGQKADISRIREGADALCVEARLYGVAPARDAKNTSNNTSSPSQNSSTIPSASPSGANDSSADSEEETIVMRKVDACGRSKSELNGHMCTLQALSATVGETIDICGQHAHQRLLNAAYHEQLLDSWQKHSIEPLLQQYKSAFMRYHAACDNLKRITARANVAQEGIDAATYVIQQIDTIAPQPGEYEQLEARYAKALHTKELLTNLQAVHAAILGDNHIHDELVSCSQALSSIASFDASYKELIERLDACCIEVDDIAEAVRKHIDNVSLDPQQLEDMRLRLQSFQSLMRNWGPAMEHVFARYQKAQDLLARAHTSKDDIARAKNEQEEAKQALMVAGRALAAERKRLAPLLSRAITHELRALDMPASTVQISCEDMPFDAWTNHGSTRVEIMYQSGHELACRPLKKIASGGEISRVMLAIKVVQGASDDSATLIFDEVDAGIGGAAAHAVARVLARLAKTHQVIVVTHEAQVAAYASVHIRVEKHGLDVPETRICTLDETQRVRELARMLSGDNSPVALTHAQKMLDDAKADTLTDEHVL